MKRIETIIKEIDELERELYTNYDFQTIEKEMDKMFKNHEIKSNGCDLIWVIYSGVADYNKCENEEE